MMQKLTHRASCDKNDEIVHDVDLFVYYIDCDSVCAQDKTSSIKYSHKC